MRGRYLVPVSARSRDAAGVAAGEELEVEVTLDTEPREVTVPPALAAALERDEAAARAFDSLSFTQKREYATLIEEAKAEATRERRLAKVLEALRR